MASMTLTPQDRKDLEKFTKFLALKSAQIIVQSRQGAKILTKCKAQTSGIDWFNLAVNDNTQVSEATKKAFNGEIVSTAKWPLCVEISLKTVDGDDMVLENWSLGLSSDIADAPMKIMYKGTIYYRMGILLKSLISVTRITPAYKLARQQSADSYSIFYNVYTGEPENLALGEDAKTIKIGNLCTPIGTISIQLQYRTKMTISPTSIQKSNDSMMVKSDHFHADLSPKHTRCKNKKDNGEAKVIDLNKPLRAGAFVDTEKIKELHETLSLQLPPEPPMAWLLCEKEKMEKKKSLQQECSCESNGQHSDESHVQGQSVNGVAKSKAIEVPNRNLRHGAEDQKLLKMLNCPFADGSPIMELASFYRECVNAPRLTDSWGEPPTDDSRSTSSDSDALSRQLQMFEANVSEFDNVVASMFNANETP